MASEILKQPNGSVLDHVGWGTPDVETGVETLFELTGDETIERSPPDPALYFSNATLRLDTGSQFIEIIGPNPESNENHPFAEFLASLSQPQILFWYVAVESLDAFEQSLEGVGYEFASTEHVTTEREDTPEYRRGVIDSTFPLTMPNVIEWVDHEQRDRVSDEPETNRPSSLRDFQVNHPKATELEKSFRELGIEQTVGISSEPALEAILATPHGSVTLSGTGYSSR